VVALFFIVIVCPSLRCKKWLF